MSYRKSRPSPSKSATKFKVGTKKKGNDENMWIVTSVVVKGKKTKRWKKYKGSTKSTGEKSRGKLLNIRHRGFTPFVVYINFKKEEAHIYRLPKNYDFETGNTESKDYTKLVKKIKNIKKVFIGFDPKRKKGSNSVLLELKDNNYIFIGLEIYKFKTQDKIIKYYSPIGINGYVYAVGIGKKNIYYLIEKMYISRNKFPTYTKFNNGLKLYAYIYGWKPVKKAIKGTKIKGIKLIDDADYYLNW